MSIRYINIFFICCFAFSCNKKIDTPVGLKADFFVDINRCSEDSCYVRFYDNSINVVARNWDFGNNINSIKRQDSTVYRIGRSFDVVLKVKDEEGNEISEKKTLNF